MKKLSILIPFYNGLQAIADGFFQNDVWSKVVRRDLLLRHALDFGTYDGADDFYFSFQLYPVCKRIKTINKTIPCAKTPFYPL